MGTEITRYYLAIICIGILMVFGIMIGYTGIIKMYYDRNIQQFYKRLFYIATGCYILNGGILLTVYAFLIKSLLSYRWALVVGIFQILLYCVVLSVLLITLVGRIHFSFINSTFSFKKQTYNLILLCTATVQLFAFIGWIILEIAVYKSNNLLFIIGMLYNGCNLLLYLILSAYVTIIFAIKMAQIITHQTIKPIANNIHQKNNTITLNSKQDIELQLPPQQSPESTFTSRMSSLSIMQNTKMSDEYLEIMSKYLSLTAIQFTSSLISNTITLILYIGLNMPITYGVILMKFDMTINLICLYLQYPFMEDIYSKLCKPSAKLCKICITLCVKD
eukprot:435660_1